MHPKKHTASTATLEMDPAGRAPDFSNGSESTKRVPNGIAKHRTKGDPIWSLYPMPADHLSARIITKKCIWKWHLCVAQGWAIGVRVACVLLLPLAPSTVTVAFSPTFTVTSMVRPMRLGNEKSPSIAQK